MIMDKVRNCLRYWKRLVLIIADVLWIGISLYLSFVTRFWGVNIPPKYLILFYHSLPLALIIFNMTFVFFGIYRGIYLYASIHDLFAVAKAVLVGTLLMIAGTTFLPNFYRISEVNFYYK